MDRPNDISSSLPVETFFSELLCQVLRRTLHGKNLISSRPYIKLQRHISMGERMRTVRISEDFHIEKLLSRDLETGRRSLLRSKMVAHVAVVGWLGRSPVIYLSLTHTKGPLFRSYLRCIRSCCYTGERAIYISGNSVVLASSSRLNDSLIF